MTTNRSSSRTRGPGLSAFTLIEVMLAVAITAIVATLLYSGFSQTARNKARVQEDLDHYRVVSLVLDKMARELSQAFVSTHVNPQLSLQAVKTTFAGNHNARFDRIDFTSFSHRRLFRNAHESDQNEISYFVTDHPDRNGKKVLARREQNRIDKEPQRGGRIEILLEDVEGFELEYLDHVSREWVKEWDATEIAREPNRLPWQVRIKITVPDDRHPGRSQTFGTRAILPLIYALNHASYRP